jgi:polysaccharide biosynthesis transport protein
LELKTYLRIARRRWWIVLLPVLVLPVAAYVREDAETRMYAAYAEVLLKPNNLDEQISTAGESSTGDLYDPERYFEGQITVLESRAVAEQVALVRQRGENPDALRSGVSGAAKGASNVLYVIYADPDPTRAAELANQFAREYIENRRLDQITGLRSAEEELELAIAQLEQEIGGLSDQLADPATTEAQARLLQAQFEAKNDQFQSISDRLREIRIDMSLKRGEAELVEQAVAPWSPYAPTPRRAAQLALLLGLAIGVGLALVLEQFDDRLRRRSEVEQATGLKVVAELPRDRVSAANAATVATLTEPHNPLSEAVRQLRTSIRFFGLAKPIGKLLITSSDPSEGKSLVSANLAVALAQAGQRTVLVSADIRRPRLDGVFGPMPGAYGLVDVIADVADRMQLHDEQADADLASFIAAKLDDALVAHRDLAKLRFLPAGQQPPNPAEILGSPASTLVFEMLRQRFADIVVIDSPPALAVADALVLSRVADATLIVASAGQTRKHTLLRTIELFEPSTTRVLGVVLNKSSARSGYGYGYGYGYTAVTPAQSHKRRGGSSRRGARSGGSRRTSRRTQPGPVPAGVSLDAT